MTDLEFVQNCYSGNKLAWDAFVEKYSLLVYKYINCVLRQKNPLLATPENLSDIFQEIFFLLSKDNFKKLKTYKGINDCSLASWLRQVVVNFTIDFLKKQRKNISLDEENEEGLSLKDLLADHTISVRQQAFIEEKLEALKECIAGLDIDDKYFLEFHIRKGLSLERVKEILRASRGAIDMRKARIIVRLRECFKNKGFFS